MGSGLGFYHSVKLETEYLSTEWMEDVKFCVDKAQENDLELWIYDEDKWPVGGLREVWSSKVNPAEFTARALDDGVRESRGAGGTGEAKYRGRKDSYRGLGFVNVWRESRRGRKFHVWQERR